MALDDHQLRNLKLAEWNAYEAIGANAVSNDEAASYHMEAARECLMIVGGCRVAELASYDELAAIITQLKDTHGVF